MQTASANGHGFRASQPESSVRLLSLRQPPLTFSEEFVRFNMKSRKACKQAAKYTILLAAPGIK